MWTLEDTLGRIAARLDPALVPAPALARLRETARRLPAALTRRVYLESWLGATSPRVDLIVKVDDPGRALLADPSLAALGAELRGQPGWQAVGAFVRAWNSAGSRLAQDVKTLWLEFDLDPADANPGRLAPRVFVDFQLEAQGRPSIEDRLQLALEALRCLGADALAVRTTEQLRTCIERLPAGATLPFLGLSLGERASALRVCAQRLGSQVTRYLAAVGWQGDVGDLRTRLLAPLAEDDRFPVASVLHLDASPLLAPRIGLEFALAREGQPRGQLVETAFLDHLVAQGWCTAADRAALLGWPGSSIERLAHEIWPSRVVRRLNHLKLTYASGERVGLKAYMCFLFNPFTASTLVGRRPWWFGSNGAPAPFDGSPARSLGVIAPGVRRQVVDRQVALPPPPHGAWFACFKSRAAGGVRMTMSESQQQALEKILTRATEDREFRSRLLSDPRQAISEAFGISIPAGFRVKFVEKDPDVDALIVLPGFRHPDGELGDRDLETVAGGGGGDDPDTW